MLDNGDGLMAARDALPTPLIPASVSIRTHKCMQWPLVAAVLTDVIFNWFSSEPARPPAELFFCNGASRRRRPTRKVPLDHEMLAIVLQPNGVRHVSHYQHNVKRIPASSPLAGYCLSYR